MTTTLIDLLKDVDETQLTDAQKVSLLWKAIMGYGSGTARIPGILEQAAHAQKQTALFSKVGLSLVSVFGLLMTHETIGQFVSLALKIFGLH